MTRRPGSVYLTLVTGSPCSGKSSYVDEHRRAGDVVLDHDAIAVALGSAVGHGHRSSLLPFVEAAVDGVLARVMLGCSLHVWLIRCVPTARDRAIASCIIHLAPGRQACRQRAIDAGRPARWLDLIDRYHSA